MNALRFYFIVISIFFQNYLLIAQKDENLLYTFKKHSDAVTALAFSPDGKYLATGGEDKVIYILDFKTGEPVYTITNNYYPVKALQFADENTLLVSSGPDIKLIDYQGKILKTFTGYTTHVWSFDYNVKTNKIIAGSYSSKINIWDYTTGAKIMTLSGHEKNTLPVCFSPDGKYAVSGSLDRTVRLWDVTSGEELQKHTLHSDNIVSVKFHPSGNYYASASYDQTVRLWNKETGKIERTYAGHDQGVLDIDFSPDGYFLASASRDNTVAIWEVLSGKKIYTFIDHTGALNAVQFSNDGQYLAAASSDKTVNVWKLNKNIFVSNDYQDKIDEEISKSDLFDPKRKDESSQQYQERMQKAKEKKQEIISKYYQMYIEKMKNGSNLGGE